jgi:hypothetical protein
MEPVSLNLSAYLLITVMFGTDASETFQLTHMNHTETLVETQPVPSTPNPDYNINIACQHNCFITQGNYVGYMFRLLESHLQAYSLQVKSYDAVHTLGSHRVYISKI